MSSGATKRPDRVKSMFFDVETLSSDWGKLRGARFDAVLHDEIVHLLPKHEMIDCSGNLDDNEKRWAAAFRKVYNVGAKFFEHEPPLRRQRIIKVYTDLAETGRGRAAEKAAEAVAVVVEYALEGKVPGANIDWEKELAEFKTSSSPTGRAQDQMNAYRYLYDMITPKGKP